MQAKGRYSTIFVVYLILFATSSKHPPPNFLIADNNGDANNDDATDIEVNENKLPTMAKGEKNKAAATAAKKAGAKMVGDNIVMVDTPLSKKAKQRAATRAATCFFTTALKGYNVNPYSRGSKNCMDVVLHDGGVPSKSKEPMISLNHGGEALCVEWKLPEKLFTDLQATAQGIPKDSAYFNGYGHTQDHMHQARVHPVKKCYRLVPQVLPLNQECTGNPVTMRWDVPMNMFVEVEGHKHRQFNSMCVTTLKVAKDRYILTLGPKFVGIANFGDVGSSKSKSGGGGGNSIGGGNRGGWSYKPPPKVKDDALSSSDDE